MGFLRTIQRKIEGKHREGAIEEMEGRRMQRREIKRIEQESYFMARKKAAMRAGQERGSRMSMGQMLRKGVTGVGRDISQSLGKPSRLKARKGKAQKAKFPIKYPSIVPPPAYKPQYPSSLPSNIPQPLEKPKKKKIVI